MKNKEKEIIKDEENELERIKDEKERLKKKWIKLSSTNKLIEFLDKYCEKKEKFIGELKRLISSN